jgi:curved DNA-binding protein CbpA
MPFIDYYKLLGLDKTATPKDIKPTGSWPGSIIRI